MFMLVGISTWQEASVPTTLQSGTAQPGIVLAPDPGVWSIRSRWSEANVYAGGGFSIAKWNGTTWSTLGLGVDGSVYSLAVDGSDIYVVGTFNTIGGGTYVYNVAKWNGANWSGLGTGIIRSRSRPARSAGQICTPAECLPLRGRTPRFALHDGGMASGVPSGQD